MSADARPVYLRLRDTLVAAILDGAHRDGDMLPSVRVLAAREGANPLTVAKAYQGLQDDGFVIVRRGVGLFLAEGASERLRAAERERFLRDVWPPVASRIRQLGLTLADLPPREDAEGQLPRP